MTAEYWQRIKDIFAEALELAPSKREAFVREQSGNDTELLEEVLRMLKESEQETGMLSRPALADAKALSQDEAPRFGPSAFLARRFRIVRFIARGGMGEVYEAEDVDLGERVALKAIRQRAALDAEMRGQFKREIQLARRVTHPNVCRIFDLAQHEDPQKCESTLLLSMELIEGQSLAEHLRVNGPLSFRGALPLIEDIAAGLQAIHDAGIVHGDLKPANVMLVIRPGESAPQARVMDFGMALPVGDTKSPGSTSGSATTSSDPSPGSPTITLRLQGAGLRGGTPDYFAPEQIQGGPSTTTTDVYAFALVIADMLGVPRDTRLQTESQQMPASWLRILRRCLADDSAQRYQRPSDVAADLRRALQGRPRRRVVIAAVMGLALAAAAVLRLLPKANQPVWLLVTALQNQSGEPVLDGAVPYLIERAVGDSSQVNVVPGIRVDDTLRLMRTEPRARVDSSLAREVCLRDGGIQLIVNSRAQKLGLTYLLSVDVVEATTGRLLGGFSGQTEQIERLPGVVVKLASEVRRLAGESAVSRKASEQRLEHVTTPSLRACQLYSLAYSEAQPVNWPVAEKLTREALAEDPEFASAHLWLAWALNNQRKSESERDAHLSKAIELSNRATDREREFILGSEKTMHGRYEEAVVVYRRMLISYPNEYWGRNNLVVDLLRLGRDDAAERYRLSDLRPNDLNSADLAFREAVLSGRQDIASRFRLRAEKIVQNDPEPDNGAMQYKRRWWAGFRLHDLWLAGKLDELLAAIDRIGSAERRDPNDVYAAMTLYETLGRFHDAQRMIQKLPAQRASASVVLEYLRDDRPELLSRIREGYCCDVTSALLAIQGNWKTTDYEEYLQRNRFPSDSEYRREADARFATIRSDLAGGAQLFSKWPLPIPISTSLQGRLLIAASLARAYELAGDDRAGLTILETADRGPLPLYSVGRFSEGAFWHRLRYERARLLRKLGRWGEAALIEDALRKDLRLADVDHPLLHRLKARDLTPLDVY